MSDKLRFGEILVRAGVVDRQRLEIISAGLKDTDDLGEQLVLRGVVNEARMLQAVGQALNLPTVILTDLKPDERALKLLNQEICGAHLVFPVELERARAGEHLHVAMANPSDIRAIKQITRKARRRIRPLVASARDIREAIAVHYGGATPERGGRRESPIDMFDFNVTDLSSMDAPDASQGMPELDLSGRGATATPELSQTPSRSGGGMSLNDMSALHMSVQRSDPPAARAPQRHADPAPLDLSALSAPPAPRAPSIDLSALSQPPQDARGAHTPAPAVDLSALSSGPVDLSALSAEPVDLSSFDSHNGPLEIDSMDAQPASLSALSAPPPAPSTAPRRAPPTSMPPRPSSDPPPGGDFGFGMIRRKRRRAASQAPPPKPAENAMLERLDTESVRAGDRVVAKYLERYQKASSRPGADEFMGMLERALKKTNSPTAQLVILLTRQLAAKGLVDAEALLEELLSS